MTYEEFKAALEAVIKPYTQEKRAVRLWSRNKHADAADFFLTCINKADAMITENGEESKETKKLFTLINYTHLFCVHLEKNESKALFNAINPLLGNNPSYKEFLNEDVKMSVQFKNIFIDSKKYTEENATKLANSSLEAYAKIEEARDFLDKYVPSPNLQK